MQQGARKRIALIFGTRPEVIKLAPVYAELLRRANRFEAVCIWTGQHKELAEQMMEVFGLEAQWALDVMVPGQSLAELTGRAVVAVDGALEQCRPHMVLVQGDTTTVLCAALAAYYRRIPIGHVEAGLRTGEKFNPFPEEINRRLCDALADLHFAATYRARDNLLREGVSADTIHVTGNTVTDALQMVLQRRPSLKGTELEWVEEHEGRLVLVTAHRRENWGTPLVSICRAVRRIAEAVEDVLVVFPVHPNPIVRKTAQEVLEGAQRVRLVEPPPYDVFVALMKRADLIITDSGGIQEEAPSLGVPVLVTRATTERPEGVEAGVAKLVGTEEKAIYGEAVRLLTDPRAYAEMAGQANPYGDGRAAMRICDALEYYFGMRGEPPEPFRPGED